MRRRFGFSLLLILAIGIAGCSSGTDPEPLPEEVPGSNDSEADSNSDAGSPGDLSEVEYTEFSAEDCRVVDPADYASDPIALITQQFIDCNSRADIEGAFSLFAPTVREKFEARNLVGVIGDNPMNVQLVRYLPDNTSAQVLMLAESENPVTNEPIHLQLLLGFRLIEPEGWKIAAVGYQRFEEQDLIQLDLENLEEAAAAARAGDEEAYQHYEALYELHNPESNEEVPEEVEETPSSVAPLPDPVEQSVPVEQPVEPAAPRTSAYPPLDAPDR